MPFRPIQKVLVANRGEIAVRVFRTCRELGKATVAVYSDADETALHTRRADEAVRIGPAPSAESYLRIDRVLEAARLTGADAVHPGYGFLSENAEFAEACAEAGLTFIGPPPRAIREMGDKTAARALMRRAGVPMPPGTPDAIGSADEAQAAAAGIGYPVLVKAAAGGGGKGMRVVESPDAFARSFELARSEAQSAFGDGRVYVEKYLRRPRHIEFQVLADAHGATLHLYERECSLQRRHQKVIEEAPSVAVDDALRAEMGAAAIKAAQACGYVGAGTVEFLLDSDGAFYFLEMNTRLQVEHPVTEMILGLDLVAEQIRIAEGEPLGYAQSDIQARGHAVECRVYAEDVAAGFLPAPGPLHRHRPAAGLGVRVDAGVEEGGEVPIHYDPMVSKLVAWAPTRSAALDRALRALGEYEVAGLETNIDLCSRLIDHPHFRSGDFDTGFIGEHFGDAPAPRSADLNTVVAATSLSSGTRSRSTALGDAGARRAGGSQWRQRAA